MLLLYFNKKLLKFLKKVCVGYLAFGRVKFAEACKKVQFVLPVAPFSLISEKLGDGNGSFGYGRSSGKYLVNCRLKQDHDGWSMVRV